MIEYHYDMPDNYKWLPGSSRYPLSDVGELAARLGSIDVFDRRGEVIYLNDFSGGLSRISPAGIVDTRTAKISTNAAGLSPFTLELSCGVTADVSVGYNIYMTNMNYNKIGWETGIHQATITDHIDWSIIYYTGIQKYSSTIRYVYSGHKWYLYDKNLTPILILDSHALPSNFDIVDRIKIVYDLITGYNKRVIIDSHIIDISEYEMKKDTSNNDPWLKLQTYMTSYDTNDNTIYIDYIIITDNEP